MAEVTTCQACGAVNDRGAVVCSDCSQPLPAESFVDVGPAPAVSELADGGAPGAPGGAGARDRLAIAEMPPPAAPAPDAAPRRGAVRHLDGDGAFLVAASGQRAHLPEDTEVILGRESGVPAIDALLAPFDAVSRRHAAATVRAGVIQVRDLNSTNGTWLDGRPLGTGSVARPLPVELGLGTECTLSVRSNDE